MAKRKSDFHELQYINPFDEKHFVHMVYKDWGDYKKFAQWRKDNSTWLKDPKHIDLLDVDELLSQWDVFPTERKITPKTCHMIFKELAIVLRMIDAEHQDAIIRGNGALPGVVKSASTSKWLYMKYDLEVQDPRKGAKVEQFDTEEEAYKAYMDNRNYLIEQESAKALAYELIEESVFDEYFSYLDIICVRPYEYYKNEEYNKVKKENKSNESN